ncbi:baculoviral IAP repeat-containing protein 7-B-like isoform X1 [Dreissena polymorpha]|nr:baculoviral IAP repeat-containing protein 7-B-like isoform X1 [Dreissena polymorpha]
MIFISYINDKIYFRNNTMLWNGRSQNIYIFHKNEYYKITHGNWNTDGLFYDISGLHHPGCSPETRETRGNIPFGCERAPQRNRGRNGTPNLPHLGVSYLMNATAVSEETASHLGIHTRRPLNAHQAILHNRMTSFTNSPPNIRARAEDMAEAGLYYTGIADCVECFYCGGVLRSWESVDDPWSEHYRWFPNCTFVQLNSTRNSNHIAVTRSISNAHIEFTQTANSKPRCAVCRIRRSNVVIEPCHHLGSCVECLESLVRCPECHELIRASMEVCFY